MQEYLVRLAQVHDSFRIPELEALASLAGIQMEVIDYNEKSPFCIIGLPSDEAAKTLISRSILSQSISELWGHGTTYEDLHTSVQTRMSSVYPSYHKSPFNFIIDSFSGKRPNSAKNNIIESFRYLGLTGPIAMKPTPTHPNPTTFVISEEFVLRNVGESFKEPQRIYFSRLLGSSSRDVVAKYDLKKRHYISTTSMDSELALVTANLALAGAGRVHYDPFAGTGSFPIACAHFGSCVIGSDLDGRSIRGAGKAKGKGKSKEELSVKGNFAQYGLTAWYLDGFVADLTNTPLRLGAVRGDEKKVEGRWLDGIVCDPPYGVREGLKVLGSVKEELQNEVLLADGRPAHLAEGYLPPKRPYSFEAMLSDILAFGVSTLVDGGMLCMWMPTANDEDMELAIPQHPALRLVSVCVQEFNKWSRRLLTYQRLGDKEVDWNEVGRWQRADALKTGTASQLNQFRRKFFEGFREQSESGDSSDREV